MTLSLLIVLIILINTKTSHAVVNFRKMGSVKRRIRVLYL